MTKNLTENFSQRSYKPELFKVAIQRLANSSIKSSYEIENFQHFANR